jgi:hypothetical protein
MAIVILALLAASRATVNAALISRVLLALR